MRPEYDPVVRPLVPPRHECRDCQAPIVFALLNTGARVPLDPMPNRRGNVAVIKAGGNLHGYVMSKDKPYEDRYTRMMPHAATCPERPGPAPAKPAPDLPLF